MYGHVNMWRANLRKKRLGLVHVPALGGVATHPLYTTMRTQWIEKGGNKSSQVKLEEQC